MEVSEKYRFSPTFSNIITMSTRTTTTIAINTTTTQEHKDLLLDPDRVIHMIIDLTLITSFTIRKGKRDPYPVVALVLLKISRFDEDFRGFSNAEKRRPHLVVVTTIRERSLCAHDTSQHGVMLLGLLNTLHNRPSVIDRCLTADEHSLHRVRATMVVAVTTAVDPGLEATHPRDMSVALRALRNHADADSSASFDGYGREQILGIIYASLEPFTLSSESKLLPTRFFNIAEAAVDHNSDLHAFGLIIQRVTNEDH